MHLNQIASFLAVSKTLNFTGAARQLGVPQSTISRQIGDLESQLGVRLFFRTKRDVQLTDEGRIFLPYAQEIADAARKGSYAVKQIHEGMAGRLNIAVNSSSQKYAAGVLAAFHEKYPDIMVDIVQISSGESLMDDTDAPFDFWFLYRDMLLDPENFEYLVTHREPLGLVRRKASVSKTADNSSKSDSAPNEKRQKTADNSKQTDKSTNGNTQRAADRTNAFDTSRIASEKFILISEEADPILYMQAMNYCRTHRFTPQIMNTFEDISSVKISIEAGLGTSFLPLSIIDDFHSGELDVLTLDDESYAIDCIVAWKPSLLNPAAALFVDVLKSFR